MTNKVLNAIEEHAEELAALGPENEALGKLTDRAAAILRDTGVVKQLQPAKHGGLEVHPREFAETVMKIASYDGSTGWVAGIVGVHPWEMALADERVQAEIWGEDTNTWIASPYAPLGVLKPVDGGFIFNGRWQFSSGTDHCDWIFLGAFEADAEGKTDFTKHRHVILPRADYTIVEDSWDVVGLRGTGSKDIIVKDAFIPEYRVIDYVHLADGTALRNSDHADTPLYGMPFTTMFPLGITSAVIGICEGALASHLAYQKTRVQIHGTKIKDDPYVMYAIGEASAEIKAARVSMLDNVSYFFDKVEKGEKVTLAERAESRRTQVSAAWRAVNAMDQIVARSGGNGLRMDNPIQRFWRDGHMGMVHAIHVPGNVMHVSSLLDFGVTPPPHMLAMI